MFQIEKTANLILNEIQNPAFYNETRQLPRQQDVNNHGSLSSLYLFLDSEGIFRMGGRLDAVNSAYDVRCI